MGAAQTKTEFTLDTSSVVERGEAYGGRFVWEDFDPFTQGYVEALFESAWPDLLQQLIAKGMSEAADHDDSVQPEFSDLSPEALAMILRDCAALSKYYAKSVGGGSKAWSDRHSGEWPGFPPLTPHLSDCGRVHLRKAA